MTPATALRLHAVYRAVAILQTGAAQLTLDCWRGPELKTGSLDLPARIASRPAPKLSQAAWITSLVASLALHGNAYLYLTRFGDGRVSGAIPLDPNRCTPVLHPDGRPATLYNGKEYGPADIAHLKLFEVPGIAAGLGPIQAAQADLTGAVAVQNYGTAWMSEAGVPNGILSTDQPITAEQAEDARNRWHARGSHGLAVLGRGMKYVPITLKPSDAQFLETREFDVRGIGRLFGIPPHLLNVDAANGSQTYQNIQEADAGFIRWTLMLYLRVIETTLTDLLPGGWETRFNIDAFLRPTTQNRYAAYEIGIRAGFLTIQEVRAMEGLQ